MSCSERLTSLAQTLELPNLEDYESPHEVRIFAPLVATYEKRLFLIHEPCESETTTVRNPILHFACLDASIAIKAVFKRFS